ncbi:MAG: hypothetical protein MUC97_04490 [Bernardetiaceae bacterium]|nr:hypothetical protein [Bernardetiaceae bacterium]
MRRLLKTVFCCLAWCLCAPAWGQVPVPALAPVGKFLADSVKIGEEVQYTLVLRHPKDLEVRFPDSTTNYAPFELKNKRYFPTITDLRGNSLDSAVYTLTTFEADSLVTFGLPVYVLRGGDTTALAASPDQLLVQATVAELPEKVALLEHVNFAQVKQGINWLIVGLVAAAVVVVALGLYLLFGERIRRGYRLRRLKRRYQRFVAEFEQCLAKQDSRHTEHGLAVWKSYLENLQQVPFASYTSKEIAQVLPNETHLHQSLKTIDRAIYANQFGDTLREAMTFLKKFSDNAYHKKVEELRNA